MKSFARHLPHYLPLLGLLLAGFLGLVLFSYDQSFQIIVAIAVAVFYVVWGVIHHLIHKDLYLAVVIEYLVVASLGLVIVFSLIFRT
jgi:hypothetical protein